MTYECQGESFERAKGIQRYSFLFFLRLEKENHADLEILGIFFAATWKVPCENKANIEESGEKKRDPS